MQTLLNKQLCSNYPRPIPNLQNCGNKKHNFVHFVLFLAVAILTGFKPVDKDYNFKENYRLLTR